MKQIHRDYLDYWEGVDMSQYSVGCREQLVSEVGALQAGRQQNLGLVVLVETLRDVKCLIELLVYELPKKCTKVCFRII